MLKGNKNETNEEELITSDALDDEKDELKTIDNGL